MKRFSQGSGLALGFCWALAALAQPAAIERAALHAFDLITHSELVIERSAAEIWPYILDTSAWKMAVESELVSGVPNELGEIRRISGGTGAQAYSFNVQTVALEVNRHKVIKIYADDGSHFGFSAWRLFELPGGTLVTYDVYSENRIPGLTAAQAKELGEQNFELNQPRFDQELQNLKDLLSRK